MKPGLLKYDTKFSKELAIALINDMTVKVIPFRKSTKREC